VELGAVVLGSLVGEDALGGLIVSVYEVTDDSQVLTEGLRVIKIELCRMELETLESVDVDTCHLELTVILSA